MEPSAVGLTEAEYQTIADLLGRQPNDLELGLFGVLWSEHCSYKSSKTLLGWLPHEGPAVVQGPGENAGVVRLNDAWDIAFKVESHNHPSYVEPVQGAATGVGGIIRDIVAMGARPLALADSLRFGLDAASRHLLAGVVTGIGQYGNAIGIPTVTGEASFGHSYRKNPLVNVLCLGIRPTGRTIGAGGARPGDQLILLGQKTGRDGIHGASLLASQDFGAEAETMRPTVQVGDPFMGKLLMEATLAAVASGRLSAVQDLGAAGLTSSIAELCYRSGAGADLWLDRVPCRETGMTPYDIMLSETQERMLLVAAVGEVDDLRRLVDHFEIPFTVIGQVVATDRLTVWFHGERAAEVAPSYLAGACPRRPLAAELSTAVRQPVAADPSPIPLTFEPDWLLQVLAAPDCRDREAIYRQYDSTIQTNTTQGPGHDAAVLRVRGSAEGICLAVSGPGRWAARDAYAGGAGAVSRVIRQLATQAASPLGLTDGINAGNPDRPQEFRALAALLAGIADAARALDTPVTGGNVSLHNETDGEAIWPTAVIGGVGRHFRPLQPYRDAFLRVGERVYLINPDPAPNLGGSVLAGLLGNLGSYPRPDLPRDAACYRFLAEMLRAGIVTASRSVGDGGVLTAIARMAMDSPSRLGVRLFLPADGLGARGFGEGSGQVVVTVGDGERLEGDADRAGVRVLEMGIVVADAAVSLEAGHSYRWDISRLRRAWRGVPGEGEA
ncbi:MAG: phosphoribosylformylglycinamidine synthase subunit PurL [Thermaerobacter sp.]|nr:phosphoribosylformylglycinamidine synthase subunit PurL [Thermaerobacter sp.]